MTNTIAVVTPVSLRVGQVTLLASWRTSRMNCAGLVFAILAATVSLIRLSASAPRVPTGRRGRSGGSRTPNLRFWRPALYQLSYTPNEPPAASRRGYSTILVTTPAPTVRPPSRIAKRRPSSIAIGTISATSIAMLSPGITISVPSGSTTDPVTSVVRK